MSRQRNRTRASSKWAAGLLLPAALIVGAWTYAAGNLTITPETKLWVEGTSTVRSWKCEATQVQGAVTFEGELGTALEDMRAIDAVVINVPIAQLDCKNGTMNNHMRKALKAAENPVINFRMTARELTPGPDGALTVNLAGLLLIAGAEKEISMTANAVQNASGQYAVTGKYELKMTEWGVKPPSLMLGTMRVREDVVVNFEIVLARETGPAASVQQ
ncbi:MAG TPA: YceI family protein [Gemmatimonadaceae bacterium]|nr:YceI family protein [Gemmatimonadaceae bacterium]